MNDTKYYESKKAKKLVNFYIDTGDLEELRAISKEENTSVSSVIRVAIRDHINFWIAKRKLKK